jgi:hypothetical protein
VGYHTFAWMLRAVFATGLRVNFCPLSLRSLNAQDLPKAIAVEKGGGEGRWIPERGSDILGDAVKSADSLEETGAHFHAQAHIST